MRICPLRFLCKFYYDGLYYDKKSKKSSKHESICIGDYRDEKGNFYFQPQAYIDCIFFQEFCRFLRCAKAAPIGEDWSIELDLDKYYRHLKDLPSEWICDDCLDKERDVCDKRPENCPKPVTVRRDMPTPISKGGGSL